MQWDDMQERALRLHQQGRHVVVTGTPGSGRTALAVEVARSAVAGAVGDRSIAEGEESSGQVSGAWAPALIITPDRKRSEALDFRLVKALGPALAGSLTAPGSHRIVRSLDSYAYLVVGLWLVERNEPLARPQFVSGAQEDAWLEAYLESVQESWKDHFSTQVLSSPRLRTEIRNIVARSGQRGLLPSDLGRLAERSGIPLWALAAHVYEQFAGGGESAFSVSTVHYDSARMPLIAANILRDWDEKCEAQGVVAPKPVPTTLVVDDLQDLPFSAVALIKAVVDSGAQMFATWAPRQACAQYRGGTPETGRAVSGLTLADQVHLEQSHRLARRLTDLESQIGSWVPGATGNSPAVHHLRRSTDQECEGEVRGALAATPTRLYALAASELREENLVSGTPFDEMALVLRTSSEVEKARMALSRAGVPVESGDRSIVLSKVPVCRALLNLLARDGQNGDESENTADREEDILDLLVSPLVDADPLDTYRLLRALRVSENNPTLGFEDLLAAVAGSGSPTFKSNRANRRIWAKVASAAALWGLASKAGAQPAQQGLWTLWEAAGVADALAEASLDAPAQASGASDILDSVLALFRKADLWQQERSRYDEDSSAHHFANYILSQNLQTDPLVSGGLGGKGVAVVTPPQAAGRQWEVVLVAGLQEGVWPAPFRDGFGQVGRLQDILEEAGKNGWRGQEPIAGYLPDQQVVSQQSRPEAAGEKRIDEARLLYLAVGRARRKVDLLAFEDQDALPSLFFTLLEEKGFVPAVRDEKGNPVFESSRVLGVSLDAMVALLRRQALGVNQTETEHRDAVRVLALLAAQGVEAAKPSTWAPGGSLSSDGGLDRRLTLSPSRLQTAQNCPLRWFLSVSGAENQDLHQEEGVFTNLERGVLVHSLAERYPRGTKAELLGMLDRKWHEGGWDTGTTWAQRNYKSAKEMAERLAAYFQTVSPEVEILTEKDVHFSVGDAQLRGRVDRIEVEPGGKARILDIKTGEPPSVAEAKESLQLLSYQVGAAKMGYQPGGAALWSLKSRAKGTMRWQEALQDLDEAEARLASVAARLGGPRFEATPKTGDCRTCPFVFVCPAKVESARGVE